ncbi:MAG TPA: magnesium transporter [Candidatus Limnocylindria bacterium]|nr:magnesium transporter [Candidatus Limnocylindria bacterium]
MTGKGLDLELLPPKRAAEVLHSLAAREAAAAVAALEGDALRRVMAALPRDRAAQIIAALEGEARERVVAALPRRLAARIEEQLRYPDDTAGALMDKRLTFFRFDLTVSEALDRIRTFREKEFDPIYVVDERHRIVGAVPLVDIVTARLDARLGDLVRGGQPAMVIVSASRDEIVEYMRERKVTVLPVVDGDRRLVGVLRQSTLMDAAEAVATESVQTMVGAGRDERALSPVTYAVRQRLPWLEINLLTAFAAASVVGLFESTIAQTTALAVLLPVVAGQSGNSGMQALAVTMRGLALREVGLAQWPRLVMKEAGTGILNGVAIAITTAVAVLIWSRSPGLALVIGTAMVTAMVIAGVSGAAIPLMLKARGIDPAQSSSIVLTTVTDVMGFFAFLGLATLFNALL